ncbi:protein NinF, partial [Escherichia coli]
MLSPSQSLQYQKES